MKAMRLQTAKKLLYTNTVPWVMFRVSALRTECRKGLNRPMILMSNNASNILSTKKNWIWGQLRVMQKELCDLDEHLDP